MKRNLMFCILSFIGGGGLYIIGATPLPFLVIGTLCAILLFIIQPLNFRYLLLIVLVILGFIFASLRGSMMGMICSYEGRQVAAEGIVVSTPNDSDFLVSVDRLFYRGTDTGYSGKLLVRTYDTRKCMEGNRVRVEGVVTLPADEGYMSYLKGIGSWAVLLSSSKSTVVLEERASPVRFFASRTAAWIRDAIDNSFSTDEGPVIKGLILGGKESGKDIREKFARVGISHLLAVSGLHVGIIAGTLAWAMEKTYISPTAKFLSVSGFLAFFCFVTGLSPSVIRASIMAAVVLYSAVVVRKQDALTSLAFTALIVYLANPFIVYNLSFQLSFLSCLGIILFYPGLRKLTRYAGAYVSSAVSVTLSAQVLLVPVLINSFQSVVPVSVITNLAAVPLASVLLVSSLLFLVLNALSIPLYMIPAGISVIIIRMMNLLIDTVEKIPYGTIQIRAISGWMFWGYYGLISAALIYSNLYKGFHNDRGTLYPEISKEGNHDTG
ncbi:MAG: ComEC/Rec2 family competence protein [Bacillota bacterium]|nr:ComEC/Rec2 family competence protein [Bacillota bacterium]